MLSTLHVLYPLIFPATLCDRNYYSTYSPDQKPPGPGPDPRATLESTLPGGQVHSHKTSLTP